MGNPDLTALIQALGDADEAAAQEIWERYYEKLVSLARHNMHALQNREADEEDVALSAMNSFFRGAASGRFPRLNDRHDLWKCLLTCTLRKVSKQRKRQSAAKRGGGQVRGESVFGANPDGEPEFGFANFAVGKEPTADFAAEVSDTLDEMLAELPQEDLREIALLKLEGFQNQEIAEKLGVVPKTIQRKLRRIEAKWQPRIDAAGTDS